LAHAVGAWGDAPEANASWIPRLTQKRRHRIETHFWQSGGGYDRNIEQGSSLLKMIDYIHMNPVRKGFVPTAEEWKWSSAGQFVGNNGSLLLVDPIRAHCFDGNYWGVAPGTQRVGSG
jgi:hypothetical protein